MAIYLRVFSFLMLFCLVVTQFARAAQLYIDPPTVKESLHFTLKLDNVQKLAGVKITLAYDKGKILFSEAKKTKETASFLHVVNGKKKGRLIVVMASARGISGLKLPLFSTDFDKIDTHSIKNKSTLNSGDLIWISGCQLMGEDLRDIPCSFAKH